MKTLFALLFVTSFASQAALNSNVKFVGKDNNAATQLCVVAAEKGMQAAKQVKGVSTFGTTCNGMSVYKFAKKHQKNNFAATTTVTSTTTIELAKILKFVPADTTTESKLCTVAAEQGLRAAVKEGGHNAKNLYCNNTTIKRFARRYAKV